MASSFTSAILNQKAIVHFDKEVSDLVKEESQAKENWIFCKQKDKRQPYPQLKKRKIRSRKILGCLSKTFRQDFQETVKGF